MCVQSVHIEADLMQAVKTKSFIMSDLRNCNNNFIELVPEVVRIQMRAILIAMRFSIIAVRS
jgi:hypothetical protein